MDGRPSDPVYRARQLAVETGSEVDFVSGDYTHTPFDADSFDYALFPKNIVECSYVEFQRLVEDVARIITLTGRLFITMTDWLDRIASRGENPNYYRLAGTYSSSIRVKLTIVRPIF